MSTMWITGFARPVPDVASFLVPIFSDGQLQYVQSIRHDCVAGWQPISSDPDIFIPKPDQEASSDVGGQAIYAFETRAGALLLGTRVQISPRLVVLLASSSTPTGIKEEIVEFLREDFSYESLEIAHGETLEWQILGGRDERADIIRVAHHGSHKHALMVTMRGLIDHSFGKLESDVSWRVLGSRSLRFNFNDFATETAGLLELSRQSLAKDQVEAASLLLCGVVGAARFYQRNDFRSTLLTALVAGLDASLNSSGTEYLLSGVRRALQPDAKYVSRTDLLCSSGLGSVFRSIGNFDAAVRVLTPLVQAELPESMYRVKAAALDDLGLLNCQFRNYATAGEWYQLRMNLARDFEDELGMFTAVSGLAHSLFLSGQRSESLEVLKHRIAIAESLGNEKLVDIARRGLFSALAGFTLSSDAKPFEH
jgi:hypothetical protein